MTGSGSIKLSSSVLFRIPMNPLQPFKAPTPTSLPAIESPRQIHRLEVHHRGVQRISLWRLISTRFFSTLKGTSINSISTAAGYK
jgi:hypothetical protein